MKNILNIARHDLKKITGSVVAIITIMGLCIVPCLYAWFNIFSNWAPYDEDATGRISVAVANMDEGTSAAGIDINVGEKIVTALEGNNAIGWVIVDSESEAREGVFSGEYYAALVMPEDFSRDVLSFMNGDLTNPRLRYYENEKKNAIAPKITGKAKTAVQEQVNATFVETLAGYVSDAASAAENGGVDPGGILGDISDRIEELSTTVDSCIVLSESAEGLTEAAGGLLDVSDTMIGSTRNVLDANDTVLGEAERLLAKRPDTSVVNAATRAADDAASHLRTLKNASNTLISGNVLAYRLFIDTERDDLKAKTDEMKTAADRQAEAVSAEGFTALGSRFTALSAALSAVSDDLAGLRRDMNETERREALSVLSSDIDSAAALTDEVTEQIRTDIDTNLNNALTNASKSVRGFRKTLTAANRDLGRLGGTMGSFGSSLGSLQSSIEGTTDTLRSLQSGADSVAGIFSNAAGSELLRTFNGLLANDEAAVAEYLANPVKMDTEVIWQIDNYGSAMAPFYTVLAQWVGALLTAVLIKVKVKKRKDLRDLRLREWFFGRFGLYLLVGVLQALIVSLGDLLYVRIQCHYPLHFVLLACINGIVFMMINYALVFALDNIGLGAGVIILVLQVAGSGGTYPVEVLPQPFKVLYPFMPFRYAMDAMRECIGGMYGNTYWHCLGILGVFFIFSVAFGLAMYRPALWLNNLIAESKAKSEIML